MFLPRFATLAALAIVLSVAGVARGQTALSAAFSYQGRLIENGAPANGPYDFEFRLFNDDDLGGQVGATVTVNDLNVSGGLFTTLLDFGATPFARDARWVQVSVRPGASAGPYTLLSPRQPLTVVPFAQFALEGGYWNKAGTAITNSNTNSFVGINRTIRVSTSEFFGLEAPVGSGEYGGMYVRTTDPNGLPFVGVSAFGTNAWMYLDGRSDNLILNNGGDRIAIERSTGDVGIGTNNPLSRLHVDGGARYSGGGVVIDGPYGTNQRSLNIYTQSDESATYSWNDGDGNGGTFRARAGDAVNAEILGTSNGIAVNAVTSGSGRAGRFEVTSTTNGNSGLFSVHAGTGNAFAAVNSGTGRAGFFQVNNAASGATALYATTNGTGYALLADGRARCDILEIVGGSDLSEGFDVTGEIEAGRVVSIDVENPGKLVESRNAYDKKVAGVVSGAGGVKTGMVMGQEGSIASGKHPVALSGRVYVWCDASNGAIEPGDLLTTSEVAGHAMKAADHERSQGATIGKAMTGLKEGRGLVLVLVNLQ